MRSEACFLLVCVACLRHISDFSSLSEAPLARVPTKAGRDEIKWEYLRSVYPQKGLSLLRFLLLSIPVTHVLYLFATITTCIPQTVRLQQQTHSQGWRLEIQDQTVGRFAFF